MTAKKTGLGRGLDALLGPIETTDTPPPAAATSLDTSGVAPVKPAADGLRKLGLDLLQPGAYQPRRDMHKETLDELADSIREQGVLSPIAVRPLPGTSPTRYEIIAGERRWACRSAGGTDGYSGHRPRGR